MGLAILQDLEAELRINGKNVVIDAELLNELRQLSGAEKKEDGTE